MLLLVISIFAVKLLRSSIVIGNALLTFLIVNVPLVSQYDYIEVCFVVFLVRKNVFIVCKKHISSFGSPQISFTPAFPYPSILLIKLIIAKFKSYYFLKASLKLEIAIITVISNLFVSKQLKFVCFQAIFVSHPEHS